LADLRHELHLLGPESQDILKKYLQGKLGLCLNAQDNGGICDLLWKHDECAMIMNMLYDLTSEEMYNYKGNMGCSLFSAALFSHLNEE
jgi:hypothetical protein